MEIRHLRHFIVVAEELHFARAAIRLGIEQSPLSQSIRNLEAQLGTKLLHRTTRRTWLTQAGATFYRGAIRILRDIDNLKAATLRSDGEGMVVRLALGEDLANEHFTRLLFELQTHVPPVRVEVRELSHVEATRLVRDDGADFAITLNPASEPGLTQVRGWSEPIMAVVPIGHSFAGRDSISLCDLADEVLVVPSAEDRPGCLAQIEALLTRYHVQSAKRLETRHCSTALSFAATGSAIALCPALPAYMIPIGAVLVPIEEEDAQVITWFLYREAVPSPMVSLVLDIAADVAVEPIFSFADEPRS